MKRLGKKRRLSSLRSTSKEVEALYGLGDLGRSIANSTRMRIEDGIKSGKINTTDEIDEIIENSRKDYRTSLEKREIKQKMKLQPKYKISHYKGSKSYIYDECNLQIFEDKLEVTYKDKKVKGSLKQMSWSIYFKGIDSIALINNRNVFEIKMVNGSEFRFIGGELSDTDYTKNLFNELESKFKDYHSKNKQEVILESKTANFLTEKDPIDQTKNLDELESDLITNEEHEKHFKRIKTSNKDKRKSKEKPRYKIIHSHGPNRYTSNECFIQVFEDKLEVTYKDKKEGNLKQTWPIYFKGINSIFLNETEFEIKTNKGSEFRFIGKEFDINYTKNLFNELESKLKEIAEKAALAEKEEQERLERIEELKLEKREREKKRQKERQERQDKLFSSKDYVLLQNFVKKYGHYLNSAPNPDFEKKVDDFKKLLELKGHTFGSSNFVAIKEIKNLMIKELKLQEYNHFKSMMLYNQPNNDLEEYVKNLADIYGENYYKYNVLFLKFLSENGINLDGIDLNELINRIFEQKELELLEKELSDFDSTNTYIIHNLDSLTGYEFEEFLGVLFDKMGFTTETTKLSGDQGADLIIRRFGRTTAVQAKRYNGKVSNKAIQEVTASIAHYNANTGMVVTTGEFTASAIELAKSNNIKLVDRQKLEELVNKHY